MKILITQIVPYKDKDGIISGFNDTGNFSILVKGIQNPKSRSTCINNPMTLADIELHEPGKTKYDILKSSDVLFSPMEVTNDTLSFALTMIMHELIVKCLTEDEKVTLFNDIVNYLNNIKKKKDVYFSTLRLIAKILNIGGYTFDVDNCSCCGEKHGIVGFSFLNGGFICRNCLTNQDEASYTSEELTWLRRIFKVNADSKQIADKSSLNKDSFFKILKQTLYFVQDNYGIHLRNCEIFL